MMKQHLAISVVLFMSSCLLSHGGDSIKKFQGNWRSLGGNWLMQIDSEGDYTEYDVTTISCLTVRESNIEEFGDRISIVNDTLRLTRGIIEYKYVRFTKSYSLCDHGLSEDKKRDPQFNFEVFSKTVYENYAFMKLNKIDWKELYETSKLEIERDPSEKTLYKVINHMLKELNDNHGYLDPTDDFYDLYQNEYDLVDETEIGDFQVANAVSENHMIEEFTKNSKIVRWGKLTDSIGYIQVKAMFLLSDLGVTKQEIDSFGYQLAYDKRYYSLNEGRYIEMERIATGEVMKRVINDLKDLQSVVIDIRFNGGGQDAVSLELLSWFNNSDKVIARQSLFYNDTESPVWNVKVNSKYNSYQKNVFLLTSQQTGSAAEVCAMGSMVLPNFKRVGMPTMGALSTSLEKKLPNGWGFAISNEYYRSNEGEVFENKGIPVDIIIRYPKGRQEFFRSVLSNLDHDRHQILNVISRFRQN